MSYVTFEKTGSSAITYKERYFSPKNPEEGIVNYSWVGRSIRRILSTCLCGLYKSPTIVEYNDGKKTLYLDFKSLSNWHHAQTTKPLSLSEVDTNPKITNVFNNAFSATKISTNLEDWVEEKDAEEGKTPIEPNKIKGSSPSDVF